METKKGFTLVELLAVLVILGILFVIAVPISTRTINNARKKAFASYVDKIYLDAQKQFENDTTFSYVKYDKCYMYDIEKDIGLDSTGNYKGVVVVKPGIENNKYTFFIYNNQYSIYGVENGDNIVNSIHRARDDRDSIDYLLENKSSLVDCDDILVTRNR